MGLEQVMLARVGHKPDLFNLGMDCLNFLKSLFVQMLTRYVFIALGFVFVGLGILGAFLPLLPTTPFLLLAAACFARSSKRFYNWLINHPWLGSYIKNYREKRAITLRGKIISLALMWLVMGYTALFAVGNVFITVILIVIGLGVTRHILSLKTIRD